MSATVTARPRLLTPRVRLSYPNLFRAKAQMEGKEPVFSCMLIFGADVLNTPEYQALRAAAQAAAVEKWGQNIPPNLRSPFRPNSEREGKPGHDAGGVFLNASSKNRPGVVHNTAAGLQPIIDENEVYGGCWVVASLGVYAYDQKGNRGVSFGLNNVLKVSDGDPLGTRVTPEDDFAGVAAPPAAPMGGTGTAASLF